MDVLTAIFGTQAKVRILRLFLFNPETPFFLQEMVERTKRSSKEVSHELSMLVKADLLKKRLTTKEVNGKKLHGLSYQLNPKFVYLDELKNFLTVASVSADESLLRRFSGVGKLQLVVASGLFVQNWESRVDLLLVGDNLDLKKIEAVIKGLEAEVGKELAYSAFETADFEYRLGIHDRLIRDILDYPHVTLLDRLGVEPS
jgi:hypothetical protein